MENKSKAVDTVYNEVGRRVILGLTGRTGSGCTTAANILCSEKINIPEKNEIYDTFNDRKKYKIIRDFMSKNRTPFIAVKITTVITKSILCLSYDELLNFLSEILRDSVDNIRSKLATYADRYIEMHTKVMNFTMLAESTHDEQNIKSDEAWTLYFEAIPTFTQMFKRELQERFDVDCYVKLYQRAGDNIRASGKANISTFNPDNLFHLPKIVNKLVKVVFKKHNDNVYIVIDAIRNPYEAEYFTQRHANFFLVAINTPNEERIKHLRESHKYSEDQISKLDLKEYPEKLMGKDVFISQNIQKCIEIADIHINNPKRDEYDSNELISQLIWYLSLIIHPGLVTPTSTERCMQLAFSSKVNSGCISRQVGAVIADSSYSVKSIGWNSVPQGQTPCLLRSAKQLLNNEERDTYSDYEKTNSSFRSVLKQSYQGMIRKKELNGRNVPFCFKEIQNEVEGQKNQVHTRSLHAEENAFLQIAKFGGQAIKGGVLFTTASPCELCSKKAYQLGISKIYYIDPYPGIANEHILKCGDLNPELVLFSGAIGRAYHRLYQPLMPFKDELKLLTSYSISGGKKKNKKEQKLKEAEDEIVKLKSTIVNLKSELKKSTC